MHIKQNVYILAYRRWANREILRYGYAGRKIVGTCSLLRKMNVKMHMSILLNQNRTWIC